MHMIAFVTPEGSPGEGFIHPRHPWERATAKPEETPKFKDVADAIVYVIEAGFPPPDIDGFTEYYTILCLVTGYIEQAQDRAHAQWMEAHSR